MIITRTPLRVSFFGGGTDYPDWYNENGGSVISSSINKYSYIKARFLPPFFNYKFCIRYYYREEVKNVNQIKHPSVRNIFKFLKIKKGVEIIHSGDLPARGGLGSSSSFTVGTLNAVSALHGKIFSKRDLANNSIFIEQALTKENVGSQDQTIAAFGGINKIDFGGPGNILVTPYALSKNNFLKFQDSLMLFFLGYPRDASEIAKTQIRLIPKKNSELKEIIQLTKEADIALQSNKLDIKRIGKLLDVQWNIKKKLSPKVSNSKIDDIYSKFLKLGIYGGKLCGAGGGGFFLVSAPVEKHNFIRKKMNNFLHVPFRFDFTGSQIIYFSQE